MVTFPEVTSQALWPDGAWHWLQGEERPPPVSVREEGSLVRGG